MNSKVVSLDIDEEKRIIVSLDNGAKMKSEIGVILEGNLVTESGSIKTCRSIVCLYFSSDIYKVPTSNPVLYLNGSGHGIVNNMFFTTNVARSYDPLNKTLISLSLIRLFDDLSDDELMGRVVQELSGWFGGSVVGSWKHLRTYRVKFALPNQNPPTNLLKSSRVEPGIGLYLCGDYQTNAIFDGALVSGRRAVEAMLQDIAMNQVL